MRYDLNLLKGFDALYKEQNVSRAADRIGVSQPAMSAILARLRSLFKDPLFTRDRYGITPTEKSHKIHPTIETALADLDSLVYGEQHFDPKTTACTFEIAGNDYFEFLILPRLLRRLNNIAPGIRIEIQTLTQDVSDTGIMSGQSQLAFGRLNDPPDNLVMREAMQERFACLVSEKHRTVGKAISKTEFEALEHIVVKPKHTLKTGIFNVLKAQQIHRKVKCSVTHFHFVPGLVEDSQFIATLPKRICQHFSKSPALKMVETPTDFGSFPFHLAWHRRYQQDPAHMWLRRQVLECCQF